MNKGLIILAKIGTTERMVVFLNPKENDILTIINEKYGGSWVKVNEFCLHDTLMFKSEDVYNGFDNRDGDNYCVGALKMKDV